MLDCIFCKIIDKQIPADIVFENDKILAFRDINPKAKIHLLFIPKQHIASVNELNEQNKDIIAEVFLQAKNIAKEQGLAESGYRILVNTGPDSGQEVFHVHWHLLGGNKLGDLG